MLEEGLVGKEGSMEITRMLENSLGKVVAFLPNVLAALVILAIGLLVAKVLEAVTRRSLMAAGLHRRTAAREVLGQGPALERLPTTAGRIVYWVLAVVTVGLAVDALHLVWLSAGVARVLAYLPNVLAAAAIVAVGYLAGNFLYRKASSREAGALLWPRVGRGAIFALAAFMALQQLGIATAIVTIAFTVALSAMAVASALAFGLGNRELAGRVTRDWYERRGLRRREYEPTVIEGPAGHQENEPTYPKH
jgi:hypothetical protein